MKQLIAGPIGHLHVSEGGTRFEFKAIPEPGWDGRPLPYAYWSEQLAPTAPLRAALLRKGWRPWHGDGVFDVRYALTDTMPRRKFVAFSWCSCSPEVKAA